MNEAEVQEEYAAYIGIDWADEEHAFALWTPEGQLETGQVSQEPEKLHQWLAQLQERFGGRDVAIVLETPKGPLVNALKEYPWIRLYAVNPASAKSFRNAFKPSGAKSDKADASSLLEMLRSQGHKLTEVVFEDQATEHLGELGCVRRSIVNDRTRVVNKLQDLLKGYYPQALKLVGEDMTAPMALAFLSKWPDLLSLKKARPETVRKFYYGHNVRRKETIEERLEVIRNAKLLTKDQSSARVAILQLRGLIAQLRALNKQIAELDVIIAREFKEHPESYLYRDLPGAGPALAPRLLAALGTERQKFPDAESLAKATGIAPVTKKSGKTKTVQWRWAAPKFLRQSFVEWAHQTVRYSQWAAAYYQLQEAKGKDHNVIIRALAFKWIRILWRCWQDRVPYDENRYLQELDRRDSPYAPKNMIRRQSRR